MARSRKSAPSGKLPYASDRYTAQNAIVGIGASAGGLEALEKFFPAMPADSEIAFIVVTHLDPHHISLLPTLLARKTPMTVQQAEHKYSRYKNNFEAVGIYRDGIHHQ